ASTGQQVLSLKGHTGPVWGVCFSPDGKRLASASDDHTVKVWDAGTGQEVLTARVRASPAGAAATGVVELSVKPAASSRLPKGSRVPWTISVGVRIVP